MALLYDFLFILFSLLYVPYLLLKRKWHKDFGTRFGFLSAQKLGLVGKKRIWIHAVSVGEVMVVSNLLKKMRTRYSDHQIVISVVTQTGFELAKTKLEGDERVIYAPLDLSFAVRQYLDLLQPSIYLNAETEIWPNLLTELHKRSIPIVQVNGRISDKALKGYKFLKCLLRPVLACVDCFCMQSESDASRIKELGALEEKVFVVGNMKFDDVVGESRHELSHAMLRDSNMVLVAGSTHPGEEEILLDIVCALKAQISPLVLVLAPRHPDRAGEIMSLCERKGFSAVKFSQVSKAFVAPAVVVVDTIGHLRSFYALADVVFLGKSLTVQGGHNIIEPAYYGKPIVVGPFMQNFRDITKLFLDHDALVQVKDKVHLQEVIAKLFNDQGLRQKLGANAQAVIKANKGATEKTFALVSEIMG